MDIKLDCALLSLRVYKAKNEDDNWPDLDKMGYEKIEYREDDSVNGFSYGVFKNKATGKVIIAYTGTNENLIKDFALSNVPAGMGLMTGQVLNAAEVYARVVNGMQDSKGRPISDASGSNVVFAGYSMGRSANNPLWRQAA